MSEESKGGCSRTVEITMRMNSYVLLFGLPAFLALVILGTMVTCRFLVFPVRLEAPAVTVLPPQVSVTPSVTAAVPPGGIQVRVTVPEIVVPPSEVTVQEIIREKAVCSPVTVQATLETPPGLVGGTIKFPDVMKVAITELPTRPVQVLVEEKLDVKPGPVPVSAVKTALPAPATK